LGALDLKTTTKTFFESLRAEVVPYTFIYVLQKRL